MVNVFFANSFFASEMEERALTILGEYSVVLAALAVLILLIIIAMVIKYNQRHFTEKILIRQLMEEMYPAAEAYPRVGENENLRKVYDLMQKKNLEVLPVVEENHLTGIIRKNAIERKIAGQSIGSLRLDKVSSLKSRNVATLAKPDNLAKALKLIEEKNADLIVVTEQNNYFLGAISKKDILERAGK